MAGGKLEGLELLANHHKIGFKTIPFYELDHSLFEYVERQRLAAQIATLLSKERHVPSKLPSEINERVKGLAAKYDGKPVIVRSHSLREGQENSFRGIYDSVIVESANHAELSKAILSVYNSFYSERARMYRQERGVNDDKMGVLVGSFIEPDFSGVMLTSHPSYPSHLTIEFCEGRNRVVDGSVQPFIVEFDKKKRKQVFQSEEMPKKIPDLKHLMLIGKSLEQKVGPSYVEFVFKDEEVYLVQHESISNLEEPSNIQIPKYSRGQFLGATNIFRGNGKITLPIVTIGPLEEMLIKAHMVAQIDPKVAFEIHRRWFNHIIEMNKKYSDGYILITPHFHETNIGIPAMLGGLKSDTTMDGLTSNKKAVITTQFGSISSHIMTIAYEKGILYAGFEHAEDRFDRVDTGDILSIYFKGRQARAYKEKEIQQMPKSAREEYPNINYIVDRRDGGELSVTTSGYMSESSVYTSDFQHFLNMETGSHWEFKPFKGVMGGIFTDNNRRSILMSMSQMSGQYHSWVLESDRVCQVYANKTLPKVEFDKLMERYVQHLTK